jgi:hypothetical protein
MMVSLHRNFSIIADSRIRRQYQIAVLHMIGDYPVDIPWS